MALFIAQTLGAVPWLIPGFACRHPKIAVACDWPLTLALVDKARVMVVSEEGTSNCVLYLYQDENAAEYHAGRWKYTSRIMFDLSELSDKSELKELKRWGPAMPYNTIRKAATKCQNELWQARSQKENLQTGWQTTECAICVESLGTNVMPCCGRVGSTNRICKVCLSKVDCCPFCRLQCGDKTFRLAIFRRNLQGETL